MITSQPQVRSLRGGGHVKRTNCVVCLRHWNVGALQVREEPLLNNILPLLAPFAINETHTAITPQPVDDAATRKAQARLRMEGIYCEANATIGFLGRTLRVGDLP